MKPTPQPVPVKIMAYRHQPAQFLEYDPVAPVLADLLARDIRAADNHLRIEHVGSSAVPGCGGKGVIDLLILYPEGLLEAAKRVLAEFGYQPQPQRDPFPEDRPMRVGSVEFQGVRYNIHAHVIAATSPEAAELLQFRDRLRTEPALREAYETEKRRILSAGVSDSLEYSIQKGDFVRAWLNHAQAAIFRFIPLNPEYARSIAGWHYPGEYAFYDMASDPEDRAEILNSANWPETYYAVLGLGDSVIGFFEYRLEGGVLTIGLGLCPFLTGKGLGLEFTRAGLDFARQMFHPAAFRLRVATFNRRAIKVYERAGFRPDGTEWFKLGGRDWEFLWMRMDA
jgi:ribosomal-protein-alanine N-acetyltransferase